MSNPLATFRKHRTYWMAGLVLLAILAFVVAPAIEQTMMYMRTSGIRDDVVVRWKGGQITQSDLQYNREQHGRMLRLLHTLAREVIEKGGRPKVPGFSYDEQKKQVSLLGIPEHNSDLAQCRTRLLAVRAKQLGLEFSNEAVDTYLKEFCDKRIERERFQAILKEQTDNRLTKHDLYEQLKVELAAVVMERLALSGVHHEGSPLLTPGKMWQNFLRLNQSARVEAFPVLPDDFVKKVTQEPTPSEIEELYALGSQNFPTPGNSRPAFRRRYVANIEFVSANWDQMVELEKGKISEEKVREEYDRLVKLNQLQVPADTPVSSPGAVTIPPSTPASSPSTASSSPSPSAESPPSTGQPPAPAAPVTDAKKEGDAKPSSKNDAPPAPVQPSTVPPPTIPTTVPPAPTPNDGASPAAKPENAKPSAGDPPVPAPVSDAPKSGHLNNIGSARFRYVSMLQENAPPPVVQPPQLGAEPAPNAADAGALPDAPKMRPQTFEEAKDTVARQLAIEPVRVMIQAKLTKIEQAMSRYASAMSIARLKESESGKSESVAKRPDLKKLAEEEGLIHGQTGKIDGFKLAALPVGLSTLDGRSSVANSIMTPDVELYRNFRSDYFDQSALQRGEMPQFQQFVLWKIEQELAYTPTLSEVRQQVIDAWKLQKAQILASEEAERLSKKIASAGSEPWKSVLQPAEQALVINTPIFTWMTTSGGMFGEPIPTIVQGLDTVGTEFMSKVFSTPPGQVTVAANDGRTRIYVARVVETTPTTEELQQRFQADSFKFSARQLAMRDTNQLFSDWYESIESALQVDWVIPPEQLN